MKIQKLIFTGMLMWSAHALGASKSNPKEIQGRGPYWNENKQRIQATKKVDEMGTSAHSAAISLRDHLMSIQGNFLPELNAEINALSQRIDVIKQQIAQIQTLPNQAKNKDLLRNLQNELNQRIDQLALRNHEKNVFLDNYKQKLAEFNNANNALNYLINNKESVVEQQINKSFQDYSTESRKRAEERQKIHAQKIKHAKRRRNAKNHQKKSENHQDETEFTKMIKEQLDRAKQLQQAAVLKVNQAKQSGQTAQIDQALKEYDATAAEVDAILKEVDAQSGKTNTETNN